jgi:hypothetical protein
MKAREQAEKLGNQQPEAQARNLVPMDPPGNPEMQAQAWGDKPVAEQVESLVLPAQDSQEALRLAAAPLQVVEAVLGQERAARPEWLAQAEMPGRVGPPTRGEQVELEGQAELAGLGQVARVVRQERAVPPEQGEVEEIHQIANRACLPQPRSLLMVPIHFTG